MKKHLLTILILVAAVVMQSCEGPAGPAGADGVGPWTRVIELDNVNFNTSNDFGINFTFPPNEIEVLEGDIVMVYILWDLTNSGTPIWRALPQQAFFSAGILQYNFSHTYRDVDIFLDGQLDLSTVPSDWRTNQSFRIAIIPTKYTDELRTSGIDYTNYDEVAKFLNVAEKDIVKVKASN